MLGGQRIKLDRIGVGACLFHWMRSPRMLFCFACCGRLVQWCSYCWLGWPMPLGSVPEELMGW